MQGPLPTAEGLAAADFDIQSNDFVSQVARFLFFETLHSRMNTVVIVGPPGETIGSGIRATLL